MISRISNFFSWLSGSAKEASYQAIPETLPMDGWKEVAIQPADEPLVPLGAFAGDLNQDYHPYSALFTDGIYFSQHDSSPYEEGQLDGALLTGFVRKSVADALLVAQSHLPKGHAFVIWDTYRTLEVQQALFEDYRDKLVAKKGMSIEEANEAAQQFVSIPSTDPSRPSPHNTGASVDLGVVRFEPKAWELLQELNATIAKEKDPNNRYLAEMMRMKLYRDATPLNMGTAFDEMSEAVFTRHYEEKLSRGELKPEENEFLMNRRMLHDAMAKAGFSNYPEEWFHHDLGNQFDAKRTEKPHAVFGAATLSEENLAHEKMRQQHRIGSEIYRTTDPALNKLGEPVGEHPLAWLVREVARRTGNLRANPNHPKGSTLDVY